MKRFLLPVLLILTFILVACVPSQASTGQTGLQAASASSTGSSNLSRSDSQGEVIVEVTPLNLNNPSNNLEFNIAMNTHMVDLSMNLATLATLTTDTGITVQATSWDGPGGGHHVSGKLTFPATKDGKSILEGASKLTLTILNVDAPSRVFEWQLK